MVKPILLYASDFWVCVKLPKNNQMETQYVLQTTTWCTKTNQYYGHSLRTRYGSNDLSCLKGINQKLES